MMLWPIFGFWQVVVLFCFLGFFFSFRRDVYFVNPGKSCFPTLFHIRIKKDSHREHIHMHMGCNAFDTEMQMALWLFCKVLLFAWVTGRVRWDIYSSSHKAHHSFMWHKTPLEGSYLLVYSKLFWDLEDSFWKTLLQYRIADHITFVNRGRHKSLLYS